MSRRRHIPRKKPFQNLPETREQGYSRYATGARQQYRDKNKVDPPTNYVGPARPGSHASRRGMSRIAGYSQARQGGREEARARADDRAATSHAKREQAYSSAFGGLKEYDRGQKSTRKVSTPNLDAYAARQNDPARRRPTSSVGTSLPAPPPSKRPSLSQRWENGSPVDVLTPKRSDAPKESGPLAGFFDPADSRSRENWEKRRG